MTMISARIERLPFSAFHRRLLLMGGLGYTFDAMDAAVLAFLLPVLRTQWGLTSVQTGVLGSGTFIGYFVGAMLAGMLGDIIGRRKVMMYALVIYCVASLASALANDWGFFLATRIVAGLGTGAESAIVAPFLSEFVARRYRGSFTGSLAGFFSFGFVAAALLGYLVIPLAPNAWRAVMVSGARRNRSACSRTGLDRRKRQGVVGDETCAHHSHDVADVAIHHVQLLRFFHLDSRLAGSERDDDHAELFVFARDLHCTDPGIFFRRVA